MIQVRTRIKTLITRSGFAFELCGCFPKSAAAVAVILGLALDVLFSKLFCVIGYFYLQYRVPDLSQISCYPSMFIRLTKVRRSLSNILTHNID